MSVHYFYFSPKDDMLFRVRVPLSHFKAYAEEMEKNIFQKIIDIDNAELNEEVFDEEESYNWTYFLGDKHRYAIQFPNILRTSVFISVYAFFENQLIKLYKEIQERKNIPLKIKSISGNGIEKAKTYLTDVVQIDFPNNTKEWELLSRYNKVRNCIVHNWGIVDGTMIKLIEKMSHINISNSFFDDTLIILDDQLVFDFIDNVQAFWELLEPQYMDILYPSYKRYL